MGERQQHVQGRRLRPAHAAPGESWEVLHEVRYAGADLGGDAGRTETAYRSVARSAEGAETTYMFVWSKTWIYGQVLHGVRHGLFQTFLSSRSTPPRQGVRGMKPECGARLIQRPPLTGAAFCLGAKLQFINTTMYHHDGLFGHSHSKFLLHLKCIRTPRNVSESTLFAILPNQG